MPRRQIVDRNAVAFDLKAERKILKISQVEAAKVLLVTQPTVARWEKSGGMPHVYRVVWNIYKQSKETSHEIKEHSNTKGTTASSRRNRYSNVIELRSSKVVGRRKADDNVVASRSKRNSERTARREGSSVVDSEDNRLRMKEINDAIKQSANARARAARSSSSRINRSDEGSKGSKKQLHDEVPESTESVPEHSETAELFD